MSALLNPYLLIYVVIAVATASHTAWGAAFTMQGAQPSDAAALVGWQLQGLAFALAIDATMLLVAMKMRSGVPTANVLRLGRVRIPVNFYVVTFLFVALVSAYFQLLFAFVHSAPLETAGGVTDEWQMRLQPVIDARIIIAPLALPVIALLYTVAGLGKGGEKASKPRPAERPLSSPRPAVSVSRPELDIPGVPLLDEPVSGGQDKRAIVHAYLDTYPEAISWPARRLEAATGVSKSTCNNVLKERRS